MEKKIGVYKISLIIILVASIVLIAITNIPKVTGNSITGHATSGNTVSNVTISSYLAISFCENLSKGIYFGNVTSLPVTNQNGTHNNDSAGGGSTYCINVSADSNTAVDFCTRANWALNTSSNDVIGLGNETYNNATSTDSATPDWGTETALTQSYVKSGYNVPNTVAGANYYRFWLDIPASQAPGTYNNTIYFEGVTTGGSCS